MAPQLGNYVLETATAPGTGSFTLNGPETDRRSFSAAFPNGGSVFYFADDGSSAEWGVGTLTIGTPSTLSRTTVLGNTANTRAALNFPGTVEVYNEVPAEHLPILGTDGSLALTGPLTVNGKPAVLSGGGAGILQATIDAGTGCPSFQDGAGGWHPVQPYGSYATNTALSAEASSRASADTNMQNQINNRVLKTGDTMTGTLAIEGNTGGFIAQYNPGSPASGSFINYPGFASIAEGRGGKFYCQLQEQVGATFRAIMALQSGDGPWRYVKWGKNERINDSQFGDVAYVNDLGKYSLLSQLPLDPNKIILAWNGYVGGGDQSIPFPHGLSYVDTVIVVCSKAGNAAAAINVQGWNNSSVQVHSAWFDGRGAGEAAVNYRAIVIGNK